MKMGDVFSAMFDPMRSRQTDVISAHFQTPWATDAEIAKRVGCSTKTVKKWRHNANHYELVCRDASGAKFTVRLKGCARV